MEAPLSNPKPLYASSRWTAYVLTLVALAGLVALHAPQGVAESLATAIAIALPILIGGEAARRTLVDRELARKDPPPAAPGAP
jgi:hypothetical protein